MKVILMLHNESRNLLVEAFEKTHDSKEVAKMFSVDRSTVYRLVERMRREGNVDVRTSQRGRKAALSKDDIANIEALVKKQADITMKEIVEQLHLSVCPETVRQMLRRKGYSRKKKTLHATEQERPRCAGKTSKLERHYIWCRSGSSCLS